MAFCVINLGRNAYFYPGRGFVVSVEVKNKARAMFSKEPLVSLLLFFVVLFLFLFFPDWVRKGVSSGLDLCVSAVLPSLFPFAVLSSYFVNMEYPKLVARPFASVSRRLFASDGRVFAVWVTGIIAGFPVGGKTAASMYRMGQIDKRSAQISAAFSNCPSPAFVIAFCGGLFDSSFAGFSLFLILTLSSLISGVFVCRVFRESTAQSSFWDAGTYTKDRPSVLSAFTESCVSGGEMMLTVCSYVTFFSAILSLADGLLLRLSVYNGVSVALLRGLFELTAGISALYTIPLSQYRLFVTASFMLSMSGLCANMQVMSFLKRDGLSVKQYLVGRALITVLSVILASLVGLVF